MVSSGVHKEDAFSNASHNNHPNSKANVVPFFLGNKYCLAIKNKDKKRAHLWQARDNVTSQNWQAKIKTHLA